MQKTNYAASSSGKRESTWSSDARKASQGLRTFKATFASNTASPSRHSKNTSHKFTWSAQKGLQSRTKITAPKTVTFSKWGKYQKKQGNPGVKPVGRHGATFFQPRKVVTGITSNANIQGCGPLCRRNSSVKEYQEPQLLTATRKTSGGTVKREQASPVLLGKSTGRYVTRKC